MSSNRRAWSPNYDPQPLPPRDREADDAIKAALVRNSIDRAVAFGEGLPEAFFDYADVPVGNRDAVQKLTKEIKSASRRHLEAVAEIGDKLLEAKDLLGHGNFAPWLAAEFRWSERCARDYMAIARHFSGKTANFADIDLGTAREVARAPAEVRNEVLNLAAAGKVVGKAEVRAKLVDELRLGFLETARITALAPVKEARKAVGLSSAMALDETDERSAKAIISALQEISYEVGRCRVANVLDRLTDDDRQAVRTGIEAVLRLREVLEAQEDEPHALTH